MRTSMVILVPCVLLAGLLFGVYKLHSLTPAGVPCTLGACPSSLHESDSGKTFFYNVAGRFSVYLDAHSNPKENLRCIPEGVIAGMANAPQAVPPLYAATFEGTAPGTCTLTDDHFSATIVIQ